MRGASLPGTRRWDRLSPLSDGTRLFYEQASGGVPQDVADGGL